MLLDFVHVTFHEPTNPSGPGRPLQPPYRGGVRRCTDAGDQSVGAGGAGRVDGDQGDLAAAAADEPSVCFHCGAVAGRYAAGAGQRGSARGAAVWGAALDLSVAAVRVG